MKKLGTRLAALGAVCAVPQICFAQTAQTAQTTPAQTTPEERGTFSVLFENDYFFHTDRDYTNGVELAWTSSPSDTPDWSIDWARKLPFFAANGEVRTSYSLWQNIYTPSDLHLSNPPPTARPYAGWLYFSYGLIEKSDTTLDQLQVQLGMVGPASLAEETQKFVHAVLGDTNPQGWGTQLHNEPAFLIGDERAWRALASGSLAGFSFDVDPHLGAAVGTVYDYANAGAMVRVGFNLPDDYGPPRIEPSLPGTNFFEPTSAFGWYLFAGVDGRAVARNLFLDGNTWESSRHVEKIPLVGDLEIGAAISFEQWRLSFMHVFRTREYTSQVHADQFGAIDLSYRF
ncbi:MAG TPA: lipid A deacylase LpxR family protein [Rhizomicrobium sp.]